MGFDFSTTINRLHCHIRTTHNAPIPGEIVNEQVHKHFLTEFHCVFQGTETITLPPGNKRLTICPGQVLLIPAETYHSVATCDGPVERLCFRLSLDGAQDALLAVLLSGIKEPILFSEPAATFYLEQYRALDRDAPLLHTRQGMLLVHTVLQLLCSLGDAKSPREQETPRSVQQKRIIEDYIELHYTDDGGLAGLADCLFLSQRQTRKLVRQFLGHDFKTVIIRRRMELAQFLLQDSSLSLEEIAWRTGYRSYSGFQLAFRKHFGTTPSQMRA